MKRLNLTSIKNYKTSVNYPIFVCFFFLTNVLSAISFSSTHLQTYFFFPVFLQNTIETLFLVIISEFILKKTTRFGLKIFSSIVFTLFLVHVTNFLMLKLLDETLSYLLKFFVFTDLLHIIKVFHAINMNQIMMFSIISLIVLIPFIGYLLYVGSDALASRKPIHLSLPKTGYLLTTATILLLLFDATQTKKLNYKTLDQYKKTLALGQSFFNPLFPTITLPPLSPPEKQITTPSFFTQKPNIYIFVIETLRKDFIQTEQAPFLTYLCENYITSKNTFSNANSTQNSWFSIFHSSLPFHWKKMREEPLHGSLVIQQLHQEGYKMHAFCSSDLTYFDMDQMIFGKDRKYLSSILEEGPNREIQSWEKDLRLVKHFQNLLTQKQYHQGQVFIFFLDATHSEYSFPENTHTKFTPIVDRIDYLTLNQSNLNCIKNRYKNAIYFIDTLIKNCFETLESHNLLDDAVIAITGDHGEEFFEEGALFHGTHLNDYQTSVPIILKCQSYNPKDEKKLLTHIDIFPTIFDYLAPNHPILQKFDGKSFFNKKQEILVQGLQNGAKNPTVFRIQDENLSIYGEFSNNCNIYQDPKVKIYKVTPDEIDSKEKAEKLLEKAIKKTF